MQTWLQYVEGCQVIATDSIQSQLHLFKSMVFCHCLYGLLDFGFQHSLQGGMRPSCALGFGLVKFLYWSISCN